LGYQDNGGGTFGKSLRYRLGDARVVVAGPTAMRKLDERDTVIP